MPSTFAAKGSSCWRSSAGKLTRIVGRPVTWARDRVSSKGDALDLSQRQPQCFARG
jgi:hypothetical protein